MKPRLLRLAGAAGLGVAIGGLWVWFAASPGPVPSFTALRAASVPSEAYLRDRNGVLLQVQREDFSTRRLPWVALDDISPALQIAVLQAEDRRFRDHSGIDFRAFLGAIRQGVRGDVERGASTLTMQLASELDRSLAPRRGQRRSLFQKLRQIRYARKLESSWTKDQILEAYLNEVDFRAELKGVGAAARALFGKAPSGLTLDESWLLAALLPSPAADPAAIGRRACSLKQQIEPVVDCNAYQAFVQSTLTTGLNFEPEADLAPQLAHQLLHFAGQTVQTTLEASVQGLARSALKQQLVGLADRNVRDGAALVVDNATGEVVAYVGSAGGGSRSPLVDGVRARRQAGSTLKPFLYGLALENKYLTAASLLDDSPVRLDTGSGLYIPQDYDRDFHGLVSVRSALAGSLNVPAVRTLVLVGADPFVERLNALGYSSINQTGDFYGFSLALGSAEVTLMEQVNAFRTLANAGQWSALRFTSQDDRSEAARAVMSAEAAFIIGDILADRGARAITFGFDNVLTVPFWAAVKTGTSKFMRDNWCIGYSKRYTVGVWVGNFDGEPMHDVSGVAGAAPVWLEIMTRLNEGSNPPLPSPPSTLVRQSIHFAARLEPSRTEWFIPGTELMEVEAVPAASLRPRLESPPSGMIVALDPDIPATRQQILFRSEPQTASLQYELDGVNLASADRPRFWAPQAGAHVLRLVDAHGNVFDQSRFSVRAFERGHLN